MITAANPADAWVKASEHVLVNGLKMSGLIEDLNLVVEISNPIYGATKEVDEKKFDKNFRKVFGDDRIDYAKKVTFIEPEYSELGTAYTHMKRSWKDTYWGRMINFNGTFNQIENVIKILKQGKQTKRCEIIIYEPTIDARNMYKQPCLLCIDIKPRGGFLTMTAFFRSQALSKSGYADFTALNELLYYLGNKTGIEPVKLTCIACSSHIRSENQELKKTKQLLELCRDE